MKIFAVSDDGVRFILTEDEKMGQIYDQEKHLLYPPQSIATMLTRGTAWEPYDGVQEKVNEWLKTAKKVGE